ncbi:SulP family inorganic anion transporter [Pseudomonas gingeri]|uniref:SulP family inorganic anion transporter n=1 Tax=Pseudomonas gingeri TaxID=117681 RepID=A0A7Y7Y9W9_9PSED|nr:SulP family inorganic anion transporter [Pseudomonas gingeri]NWB26928.1 SulP family inorganic anion transporter [Pseudomonas gingeri]NWC32522.1 SulP family inorganic anion transporter [Pseudomonas gingeri]NWD05182.1 SulP family inorganic anion transporter [Pseudomonas gingeri]NWD52225.1 SulP family inorganic anion transporter [Pseudomonas gingeri]NWE36406.1 SulP family inorganic anion transporter [Pseudomonas gingeri]
MREPSPLNTPATPAQSRRTGADLIAGLSIAGLLLPEAVAYSTIASLPPQAGVIALFAGLLCYGLFGTSRFAIVSATSSSAAVLAAATLSVAGTDIALRLTMAIGLVLITGLMFLLAGLFKLGSVTSFIAKPVLRGFAFGLAVTIILKQVASIVDVHPEHSDLIRFIPELLGQLPRWNWAGAAVAGVALLLLWIFGRFRRLPGGLLVVVLGVAAGEWLDLPSHGVGLIGIIDLQLAVPSLPRLGFSDWLKLVELGFALVMILYAESYGSISAFALKHGDRVSSNRDLLVLGGANLLSGLFHGMPAGAGYSATSANEAAGATSRCAGVVAALVVLVIVSTLLPLIALTPEPVLAAIVIHALTRAVSLEPLQRYFTWRRDRFLAICAVGAVLLLGVLDGLLAAVAISLLLMLRQMSSAAVQVLGHLADGHDFVDCQLHPQAREVPGLLILRPGEPLFFANAERILGSVQRLARQRVPGIKAVILSLEESPDLDGTSLEALQDFILRFPGDDRHLLLARLKHEAHQALLALPEDVLSKVTLSELSVYAVVQQALEAGSGFSTADSAPPDPVSS